MDKISTPHTIIYQNDFCPHIFSHYHNNFLINHFETIKYKNKKSEKETKELYLSNYSFLANPVLSFNHHNYSQAHNLMGKFYINNLNLNWIVLNNSQNLSFSSINREGCIFTLSFDDTGRTMASSNHSYNHNIEIWDLNKRKLKKIISEHKEIVTGIEYFHNIDNVFLSCSLDKTIKLWNNYKNVHTFIEHSDWVRCIAINSDNTRFLSGCVSSVVKLWDLKAQRVISSISNKNPDPSSLSTVNSLCFMKTNSNIFLSGFRSGEIKLYDTRIPIKENTVGVAQMFKAHKSKLNSIKLNNEEKFLLSSGRDSSLRLWDLRKLPTSIEDSELNAKSVINEYKGHKCIGYNIDSNFFAKEQYIITGSEDNNIYIYDIITARIAFKIKTHQKCINLLRCIPKTYASFACTGLEDISILIYDAAKNISKCVEQRYINKFNRKEENDNRYEEEDEIDMFDEKETSQQICARMIEEIMAECGDMILKIFHSHNLTYSNGINFETLMEIIQKSNDQESIKILNMINEKFIKRLMENILIISEGKKKSNEKKDGQKKESQKKEKTIVRKREIKCLKCLHANIPKVESIRRNFDFSLLELPNANESFKNSKKKENEDKCEDKENNITKKSDIKKPNVGIKTLYSNSTNPFNGGTYLLNKFL